ncbi:hypothetical protein IVB03_14065 [Bradyrhizobium sp. 168]|uniref:hypothetical protein n=1 Tax=Bradyrhizobium sp. 168 TaxID=2782639 RepID=UPI001FF8A33B|nr:hypothetical protein [Bradyrhizobium sp. 168]MCK1580677.1 hypothetical protein [Bradyrhizobium sp. 168]
MIWKISAGALIPAIATIIFNILNFFFENYTTAPLPKLPESIFDVGVGCAFSLVGVCVASKQHVLTNTFLLVFVFLLLLILGGQVLVIFLHWEKFVIVWLTNLFCFIALSWAIIEAD